MNNQLLNEINSIKGMMGLLNEDQEMASQASDVSKIQNLAKLEGLDVDVKKYLDKTNPICEPPKTGNEENDNIIKQVWEWASNPENKNKLKDTLKKVKDYYIKVKKNKSELEEQLLPPLIIGTITIPAGTIIAVGIFIIVILIVFNTPKKSNCKKWKTIDDLV